MAVETSNPALISSAYDHEDVTLLCVWAQAPNAEAEIFFQIAIRYLYGFKGADHDVTMGAKYLHLAVERRHPPAVVLRIFLSTWSSDVEKLYALKFAKSIWRQTGHVFTGIFYAMHICQDSHTSMLTGKPADHYAKKAYDVCEQLVAGRDFKQMDGLELLLFEVDAYVDTMTWIEIGPLLDRAVECLQSTRAARAMNR